MWAFSTENWGRPKQEVMGLMRLLEENLYWAVVHTRWIDPSCSIRNEKTTRPSASRLVLAS